MKIENNIPLLQKVLSIVTVFTLVITPLSPAFAQEATTSSSETTPLQQLEPLQPLTPPTTQQSTTSEQVEQTTTSTAPQAPQLETVDPLQTVTEDQYFGREPMPTEQVSTQQNTGTSSNGNIGDTTLSTGNGSTTSTIVNNGNTNTSTAPAGTGGSGASVTNSHNGALSTNNGSATTSNDTTTTQSNGAVLDNTMNSATVTGNNSTSYNVGNSTLATGDANTTGTIINNINTNAAGVMVSEFNIVDDHTGDYILDFAANCIAGCGNGTTQIANTDNGAFSTNTASSSSTNNNTTNQTNNADLTNDMVLTADSGNNTASFNTNGDSSITTGDANVAANVMNFVNNNFAGNVVLGVVNIFGDLIGDLIIPDNYGSCTTCGGSSQVSNTDNGANSTNTATGSTATNDEVFQSNDATIENNLILSGNTGGNNSSFNTGGDSSVKSGQVNVDANILNIANTNLLGGDMWLVIINRAGQWIGQIMGAPEGSNMAASSGTEFIVDENGQITAINADNGAGSTNSATSNTINNSSTNQSNTANIVNNINLSANTGNNSSSYNTGGDSNILTGDAKVVANLINFVNNNIAGGSRLMVTMVNVFGNWTGNLFTPDQKKQQEIVISQAQIDTNIPSLDSHSNDESNNKHSSDSQSVKSFDHLNAGSPSSLSTENTVNNDQIVSSYKPFESENTIGSTQSISNNNTLLADARVAGLSTTNQDSPVNTASENVMRINLAWLVLLAPLAYVLLVLKNKLKKNRTYNRGQIFR